MSQDKRRRIDSVHAVRLNPDVADLVRAAATRQGVGVSEFLRRSAIDGAKPSGFTCQHGSLTADSRVAWTSVPAGCGCTMVPVYP